MKITSLKTYLCNCFRTNWVFVKVETDAGIHGWGEATLEYKEQTVEAAILDLKEFLTGRDPFRIEEFRHDAYRDAYWRGGPVLMSAIAGIEMALWDIKGKALGVPVYELLGGKVRDAVPCYVNGWFAPAKTPDEFAEKAVLARKAGFKGLKWDPFGKSWLQLEKSALATADECIGKVRDAVGTEMELLIEGHGRFDIPTAKRIARHLEQFDVYWFEEPVVPDDLEGLSDVHTSSRVPIAAGERLYSREQFRTFFDLKCADFIQPDVSHAGGIMEMRQIASMAEARHIPFCPHNPSGPVANAATLQLAACCPNFARIETMYSDVPYRKDICTEDVTIRNGEMIIGDKPGLGIEINEAELLKYPYIRTNLRHYRGDLTNIRPPDSTLYYNLISEQEQAEK